MAIDAPECQFVEPSISNSDSLRSERDFQNHHSHETDYSILQTLKHLQIDQAGRVSQRIDLLLPME